MDLLTTVRKEGSRGGRGDFKWSDVQSSGHRENYLGHSLMAPVGRWQKGRDLNWYAKGDAEEESGETAAEKAARDRKEEIKLIKEAEQDALARALGYDVPPRNPNMESLGDRKEVDKILKEAVEDEGAEIGKGVGFGRFETNQGESDERIQGDGDAVRKDTEVEVGAEIVTTIQGGEMDMERTTRIDLDLGLGKGCEDVGHEAEIGSIMGEVTKDEENLGRTAAVRPTTIIIGTGRGRVTINDGSEGRPLLTRLASRWR